MIDSKGIAHLVSESAGKVVPKAFLSAVLREMEREDVERIALAYMLLRLSQRKRSKVRAIESESVIVRPRYGTQAWKAWAKEPENAAYAESVEAAEAERLRVDAEADAKLRAKFNATISSAIQTLRSEWHAEWTEDLRRQTFATGDGRTVTWGEATVDDHRARIAMQERNALGAMADMARHTQAIEDMEAANVATLNELAKAAA